MSAVPRSDQSASSGGGAAEPVPGGRKVLVLYDATQTFTNTVLEHLQCLAALPGSTVYFCHARPDTTLPLALSAFDCVIIHYSVRIAFEMLSPSDAWHMQGFEGLKCLFIQDEYDHTETARRWIDRLGLHVVFTCVPQAHRDQIYPSRRFPGVTFATNLTGYVPGLLNALPPPAPLSDRPLSIGYRGRQLPYWYGELAREKWVIGQRMREVCEARGVVADIAWDERARIYGDAWYAFLGSCRATLGTESGSNVFDDEGHLRKTIATYLRRHPDASFEEVHATYLADIEQPGLMNQVSPKIFEAIALRTALILFEGRYSGVVEAGRHYLPLRKDFSNVDDVLAALADDQRIEDMTERAYEDVIASGRYSYEAFGAFVADTLDDAVRDRASLLATADEEQETAIARAVDARTITRAPIRAVPHTTAPVVTTTAGTTDAGPELPPAVVFETARPRGAGHLVRQTFMPLWLIIPEPLRAQVRPAARAVLRRLNAARQ